MIPLEEKDVIYRLSYITYTPVKDVCEFLCLYVINDRKTIEYLSQYFKRDIRIDATLYRGFISNNGLRKRLDVPRDKVTTKFKQDDYEMIAILSYALDCSPSRTVAILLERALSEIKFVNAYIKKTLEGKLNANQMGELRQILRYTNRYDKENMSWAGLLSVIVDEVKIPVSKLKTY